MRKTSPHQKAHPLHRGGECAPWPSKATRVARYTVDQIMACLDQLDLEPVLITSLETKRSIKARVVYATSCKKGQKMKGLVALVPDAPRVTADTTCSLPQTVSSYEKGDPE